MGKKKPVASHTTHDDWFELALQVPVVLHREKALRPPVGGCGVCCAVRTMSSFSDTQISLKDLLSFTWETWEAEINHQGL